jgi:hypothetical protein
MRVRSSCSSSCICGDDRSRSIRRSCLARSPPHRLAHRFSRFLSGRCATQPSPRCYLQPSDWRSSARSGLLRPSQSRCCWPAAASGLSPRPNVDPLKHSSQRRSTSCGEVKNSSVRSRAGAGRLVSSLTPCWCAISASLWATSGRPINTTPSIPARIAASAVPTLLPQSRKAKNRASGTARRAAATSAPNQPGPT